MKERPNLDEVIADIQKMIDENQRSYIRYIHVGTLTDILHLLKEREPKPPVVKENSYGWKFYYCPSCGKEFYQNNKFNFCEKCGQEIKWDVCKRTVKLDTKHSKRRT